jgi:signal transduction histidine kinase
VAYFDQLQVGRHVFKVRAANDDGLWNESGATLALNILPFFWQTAWFRGLSIGVLCGVVLLWVYRLKVNLQREHAAQEAFTHQLILSQENERNRVASELHDGLGQELLLVKNRLRLLAEVSNPELATQLIEISATTSQAIADVRSISHGLRPSALEQVGLTKAIEWMIEQIAQSSPVKYSAELENIDGLLTPEMEINVYRIVQEALNNVIKHSEASEVIVELKKQPETILVSVYDNGRGFDAKPTERNGRSHRGFGLTTMAERTKVLGGRLELHSARGTGTRLTVHVPLTRIGK